jgi:excisionase family DNA binding protein
MGQSRITAKVREIETIWLTVAEVTRYLGFASVDTQREWRDSGRLPYYLIGRVILYKKAEVDKFIEQHRIGINN